mmetsp:Transcript_27227/g.59172  ORF Transcript_27227/g.59172 Transcript_27227/m.59172 type:complete len:505 (+) Transcript_27227:21-1535(+)
MGLAEDDVRDDESFCSAQEDFVDPEEEAIKEAAEEDDPDQDLGEVDDLEYLTLDLVNVLPPESWSRLLEILRSREGRAMDMTRQNEELRREVSSLRKMLASGPVPSPNCAVNTSSAKRHPNISADCGSSNTNNTTAGNAAISNASNDNSNSNNDNSNNDSNKHSNSINNNANGDSNIISLNTNEPRPDASTARTMTFTPSVTASERSDLERRVAAMAAERRGECVKGQTSIPELPDELQKEASEALDQVRKLDTSNVEEILGLLSRLRTSFSWCSRADAQAGVANLCGQVPEELLSKCFEALQRSSAADLAESFEAPPLTETVLAALSDLPETCNGQISRVGLALLAFASLAASGRAALVGNASTSLREALKLASRRQYHPELQAWLLLMIAKCAPDFPQNMQGAALAWDGVGCCALAFRNFKSAPPILLLAAEALIALLKVHPRRASVAVGAKQLRPALRSHAAAEDTSSSSSSAALRSMCEEALRILEDAKSGPSGPGGTTE